MSGDNPKLILEGRKTQTRRIIKWLSGCCHDIGMNEKGEPWPTRVSDGDEIICACPYGIAGDQLWVREKWADRGDRKILYAADFRTDKTTRREIAEYITWRPSIHMPRWASRITLEIIKVRVERVQDISHDDCIAEGIRLGKDSMVFIPFGEHSNVDANGAYANLWDSLYGKGAWERNDWVWVIEFRKLEHKQ